ncbi:hypothetical protein PIB30_086692 [Stylosanthes scabra]|uniref:Uncharacterized protein n=1 Tax=Stylosanthes scabra TaxID=79078 RepID=A0ABU6RT43_9FABA|nr:hypothetical protein [Stylosanthes scabra]
MGERTSSSLLPSRPKLALDNLNPWNEHKQIIVRLCRLWTLRDPASEIGEVAFLQGLFVDDSPLSVAPFLFAFASLCLNTIVVVLRRIFLELLFFPTASVGCLQIFIFRLHDNHLIIQLRSLFLQMLFFLQGSQRRTKLVEKLHAQRFMSDLCISERKSLLIWDSQ